MGKSTTFENQLLGLLFNDSSYANWANSAGNANLYISLHTADPSSGNQNSSEAGYTGYARVAVARTTGGWTISGNNVTNNAAITFPACTGGNSNVTNVAIGANNTGTAGEIFYAGNLNASLQISNGITPSFNASALSVSEG